MNDKELVARFFMEGYQNKNYDFILKCLSENYGGTGRIKRLKFC